MIQHLTLLHFKTLHCLCFHIQLHTRLSALYGQYLGMSNELQCSCMVRNCCIPWASLGQYCVNSVLHIYTLQAFTPIGSKDLAEASWTAWRSAISWALSALAVAEAWDGTGRGNSGTSGKVLSGHSLLGTNWSKSPPPITIYSAIFFIFKFVPWTEEDFYLEDLVDKENCSLGSGLDLLVH